MRPYLTMWLLLTGALVLVVAGVNLIVDPYGIFRVVDRSGFNQVKPKAGAHGEMSKAYQVLRVEPHGLILGNSRAEVGLDPEHPSWPAEARPVYNLALPGTGTRTSLQYLQHVLEAQKESPPRVIVWGLDFMDFLVSGNARPGKTVAERKDSRLLANPDGTRNPGRTFKQLRDGAEAILTLGALMDSFATVRAQDDPHAQDLTRLGFNPMRDYLRITADEGYWAVFRQRDIENIKSYRARPQDIFDASGASSPALDDLRRVIRLCREHGIDLHLVTYPYHAHLLEIIHLTGHWPALENWKRALVQITHVEAKNAGLPPIPLWDFSLYNIFTQSAVPGKADKKTANSWYWEAGHYKRDLGNLMLDQVFGRQAKDSVLGTRLTPMNVESVIAGQRVAALAYRRSNPGDVNDLARLAGR